MGIFHTSSHKPVWDVEITRGQIDVANGPYGAVPISSATIELESGYVDPMFLVREVGFLVTITGPANITVGDVVVVGDTLGVVTLVNEYADGLVQVQVSELREWGDIDLTLNNPPINGGFTTDGPHTVTYPILAPGYVHPTDNINIVGVVVLSADRIAITRESETDGTHTKFVILDTTDKNFPTVVSETDMVGYPWGSQMVYDAAADRVYLGGFASGGTVMDVSDETNPVQGDVQDVAANPAVIGTDLIIGADGFDDKFKIWDTSTLGAWSQVFNASTDSTDFNAPQGLMNIGGDRVLAIVVGKIVLIDVSVPASATYSVLFTIGSVGADSFDGFTRDGDIVYITGTSPTDTEHIHVTALDVSTPSAPSIISSANLDTNASLWSQADTPRVIDGDLWVYGRVQHLARVNISNPASMTLMEDGFGVSGFSHTDFWSHDAVAVQAGYAWWVSVFSQVTGVRTA